MLFQTENWKICKCIELVSDSKKMTICVWKWPFCVLNALFWSDTTSNCRRYYFEMQGAARARSKSWIPGKRASFQGRVLVIDSCYELSTIDTGPGHDEHEFHSGSLTLSTQRCWWGSIRMCLLCRLIGLARAAMPSTSRALFWVCWGGGRNHDGEPSCYCEMLFWIELGSGSAWRSGLVWDEPLECFCF
jgi:hypothetical protein